MKRVTINDIRKFNPCYDPTKYLPENWEGTALDILNVEECQKKDRIWVVLRNEFFTEKQLRLFAVWCARQVQHLLTDERSINAINVAERFANGEATEEELNAALSAARSAAWRAALSAERSAAWSSAWDSAMDSALNAALSAARSAAWRAALSAARSAAWRAAWDAQIEELKRVLNDHPTSLN